MLDLATGPGYVATRAAERGASVVGVDVAGAMIALAGRLHPGLDLRQPDLHELPFEGGSFDAVVGNFLILHLGRPEQAVAGFVRMLRPGAKTSSSFRSPPSSPQVASRTQTEAWPLPLRTTSERADRSRADFCFVLGMRAWSAPPAVRSLLVPCEGALGVCGDARVLPIASAADLVRSSRAQCRLRWKALSSAPAQCAAGM